MCIRDRKRDGLPSFVRQVYSSTSPIALSFWRCSHTARRSANHQRPSIPGGAGFASLDVETVSSSYAKTKESNNYKTNNQRDEFAIRSTTSATTELGSRVQGSVYRSQILFDSQVSKALRARRAQGTGAKPFGCSGAWASMATRC